MSHEQTNGPNTATPAPQKKPAVSDALQEPSTGGTPLGKQNEQGKASVDQGPPRTGMPASSDQATISLMTEDEESDGDAEDSLGGVGEGVDALTLTQGDDEALFEVAGVSEGQFQAGSNALRGATNDTWRHTLDSRQLLNAIELFPPRAPISQREYEKAELTYFNWVGKDTFQILTVHSSKDELGKVFLTVFNSVKDNLDSYLKAQNDPAYNKFKTAAFGTRYVMTYSPDCTGANASLPSAADLYRDADPNRTSGNERDRMTQAQAAYIQRNRQALEHLVLRACLFGVQGRQLMDSAMRARASAYLQSVNQDISTLGRPKQESQQGGEFTCTYRLSRQLMGQAPKGSQGAAALRELTGLVRPPGMVATDTLDKVSVKVMETNAAMFPHWGGKPPWKRAQVGNDNVPVPSTSEQRGIPARTAIELAKDYLTSEENAQLLRHIEKHAKRSNGDTDAFPRSFNELVMFTQYLKQQQQSRTQSTDHTWPTPPDKPVRAQSRASRKRKGTHHNQAVPVLLTHTGEQARQLPRNLQEVADRMGMKKLKSLASTHMRDLQTYQGEQCQFCPQAWPHISQGTKVQHAANACINLKALWKRLQAAQATWKQRDPRQPDPPYQGNRGGRGGRRGRGGRSQGGHRGGRGSRGGQGGRGNRGGRGGRGGWVGKGTRQPYQGANVQGTDPQPEAKRQKVTTVHYTDSMPDPATVEKMFDTLDPQPPKTGPTGSSE